MLADSHNSTEKGSGTKVVKSLTSELHKKNHHFFDNCVKLLGDLLDDGIYACVTARKDGIGMLKKAKLPSRCVSGGCMGMRGWRKVL